MHESIPKINISYYPFKYILLHFRIKLIVTQKVLTIKNLNKKLNDAYSKCEHLEKLLDQQRKEYILKTV